MSAEVDILPIANDNDETARPADLIEGAARELSPFEELHGFSIDGAEWSPLPSSQSPGSETALTLAAANV